jgi:hypothetical protein
MASQLWTDKWPDFIKKCTEYSFYVATLRVYGRHSIIKPGPKNIVILTIEHSI